MAKEKEKVWELNNEFVEEIVAVKGQIKILEKQEEVLVDLAKKLMDKKKLDVFAPEGSPFKLVYSKFKKASVSWKDEWFSLAKKTFGRKKAKKLQDVLIEESRVDSSSLNIEANENYKL